MEDILSAKVMKEIIDQAEKIRKREDISLPLKMAIFELELAARKVEINLLEDGLP